MYSINGRLSAGETKILYRIERYTEEMVNKCKWSLRYIPDLKINA